MGLKATCKMTITFGMMAIPSKLYAAIQQPAKPEFSLLHAVADDGEPCLSKLSQQYICSKDSAVVDRDEAVRGYEVSKGTYLPFTAEELESLKAEKDDKLEIKEFVPPSGVSPLYFEKPGFIGPDKGSDKAFAVLVHALRDTGLVGIGWLTLRGSRQVVMLEPKENGLLLTHLRFSTEVRDISQVEIPSVHVTREERSLAAGLLVNLSKPAFKPEMYVDDTLAKFAKLLLAKQDLVPSVVERLRASLEAPVPAGWDKVETSVEEVATPAKREAK